MKFRKKPVVIEAVQLDDDADWELIASWCSGDLVNYTDPSDEQSTTLLIDTLEGTMEASLGDWIIQGVKGEFYPCKPDIFDATYEPVETTCAHGYLDDGTCDAQSLADAHVSKPLSA